MPKRHPISLSHELAWSPPDRRPIPAWSADNIEIPPSLTITGRFNPDISRHFTQIFDALQDDRVRTVTLMKPVGSGGTLLGDIWTVWAMVNDPGAFLTVFQDDQAAKDDCEDRLNFMLSHCPQIAPLLSSNRHFTRTQEIKFANGVPLYVRGPSLGNLQARRIRYLHLEECWMWPEGLRAEALGRIKDWEELRMSKVLDVSQGGNESDDLDKAFRDGNQSEWHVPCLSCGKFSPGTWGGKRPDGSRWGIVWDDSDKTRDTAGEFIMSAVLPTVRWECPECGHPHLDNERTKGEWNRLGKYVPMNPKALPESTSFHFDAVIIRSWVKQVRDFLSAVKSFRLGVQQPLVKIVQKDRARSWSERWEPGERRQETFDIQSPPTTGEKCLTVDAQAEGVFPAMVCHWEQGKCYRLWAGYLYSETEIIAKQEEYKIRRESVLIDSGWGGTTRDVYRMCFRRGWVAMKGADEVSFSHISKRGTRSVRIERSYKGFRGDPELGKVGQGRNFAIGLRWSNPTIKSRLRRMIDRGLWLEPANMDEDAPETKEYREQMSSERLVVTLNKTTGRPRRIWKAFGPNHYWDCACMSVVWATVRKFMPDMVVEEEAAEEKTEN